MKVLIINQHAPNRGDRAVLAFLLRELDRGNHQVVVSTSNPYLWRNIDSFYSKFSYISNGIKESRIFQWLPLRVRKSLKARFLLPRAFARIKALVLKGTSKEMQMKTLCEIYNKHYIDAVSQSDLVISTGGHHFTTWIAPDCIGYNLLDVALPAIFGKPVLLWSQSYGPFDFKRPDNERFLSEILRKCHVTVRDVRSYEQLELIGVSRANVRCVHESVLGLSDVVRERVVPSKRERVAGVALYVAKLKTSEQKIAYIKVMIEIVNAILMRGYKVRFYSMEYFGDSTYISTISENSDDPSGCEQLSFSDPIEHVKSVSTCQFFLGHKTHSIIMSLATGTPLVAISYHPKTDDFMAGFGVTAYCLSDKNLESSSVIVAMDRLLDNLDSIGEKLSKHATLVSQECQYDFQDVLESYH